MKCETSDMINNFSRFVFFTPLVQIQQQLFAYN